MAPQGEFFMAPVFLIVLFCFPIRVSKARVSIQLDVSAGECWFRINSELAMNLASGDSRREFQNGAVGSTFEDRGKRAAFRGESCAVARSEGF
jgi:hypothetical protein